MVCISAAQNLIGTLLGKFFAANYHPQNGYFKQKLRLGDGKAPIVPERTKCISGMLTIKQRKADNPVHDVCTAIKWVHKQLDKQQSLHFYQNCGAIVICRSVARAQLELRLQGNHGVTSC